MRYCARYKNFKYCNYHQSMSASKCDLFPGDNFIPEVSRSQYTTPKYVRRVYKRAKNARSRPSIDSSRQMLYNLMKDPFELQNMARTRRKEKLIHKIRKWAEAEIGEPRLSLGKNVESLLGDHEQFQLERTRLCIELSQA